MRGTVVITRAIANSYAVIYFISSLLLFEIPLVSAALVFIVLFLLVLVGHTLLALAGIRDTGLGVGFVVGVGVFVFVGQGLLLTGTSPSITHWAVLTAMSLMTMAVLMQRGGIHTVVKNCSGLAAELFLVLSIAMLAIGFRHQWVLPFAIPLAVLERYSSHTRRRNSMVIALVGASVAGFGVAHLLRPDRWWYFYHGNDLQFFEAISWSIAEWGVFEHPGLQGDSILAYHWLSYAFFGSLSHMALLAPWNALAMVGLVVIPLVLASLLNSQSAQKTSGLRWLLIFLATLAFPIAVIDSFAFSIVVALAFLMVSVVPISGAAVRIVPYTAIMSLLSVTLVFSKTSTAVVVCLILILNLCIPTTPRSPLVLVPVLSLVSFGLLAYLLPFREATSSGLQFIQNSLLSVNNYGLIEFLEFWLAPNTVILLIIWVTVAQSSPTKGCLARVPYLSAISLAGIPLAYLAAASPSAISSYFGYPSIYLVTFVLLRFALHEEDSAAHHTKSWIWVGIPIPIAFGFLSYGVINQLTASYVKANSLFVLIIAVVVLLLVSRAQKALAVATIALSLVVFGHSAAVHRKTYIDAKTLGADALTNWRGGNSAAFGDSDLRSVARYIRHSTPSNVVLASNNFCCRGSDWWTQYLQHLSSQSDNESVSDGRDFRSLDPDYLHRGGANYLLPAETRRRFLVQGLAFYGISFQGSDISSEQVERMSATLDFANQPTSTVATDLKRRGVFGFVVNLSLTEHRDWSEFAIERFQSGNFVYLELR
jgi:hypothetical protein